MEPNWRQATHKLWHISFLIGDFMGSVTLEIFDFWHWKFPGPLVYWRPVLEVSPAKTQENIWRLLWELNSHSTHYVFGKEGRTHSFGYTCPMPWVNCPAGSLMPSRMPGTWLTLSN
jgi:hypothetical protein